MNFLFSLLALWIIGIFGATLILRKRIYELFFLEFLAFSFFMGIGLISCQLFIYYLLNISFEFGNIILVAVGCFLFVFCYFVLEIKKKRFSFCHLENPDQWRWFEKLILLLILFQIVWVFYVTLPVPVNSYDALMTYALKAKIFYLDKGVPEGFFNWSETRVGHLDYPLLLPFLMVWTYIFTGFDEVTVTKIIPITYVFFLIFLYSQLKKLFGRKKALFGIFVISTIPQLATYVTIIYADFPLFIFVTCSFIYFMLYMRYLNRAYLLLSSFLIGFSAWVKNEASVFIFALAFCLTFFQFKMSHLNKKRAWQDLLLSFSTVFVIAGSWFIFKISKHMVNSDIDPVTLTLHRLLQNTRDIPIMLYSLQEEVFGVKKWNIFWILAIAAIILKRKKLFKNSCLYITLFLLVSIAGYFTAYMLTTGRPLSFYLHNTMARFMSHFIGIFLLLILYLFCDGVSNKLKNIEGID